MVRKKVELKQQRKDLVRAGKILEADKKLEEYWKLCGFKKSLAKAKKYDRGELESMDFASLRKIGYKVGTKDRSKKGLIKEILELQ